MFNPTATNQKLESLLGSPDQLISVLYNDLWRITIQWFLPLFTLAAAKAGAIALRPICTHRRISLLLSTPAGLHFSQWPVDQSTTKDVGHFRAWDGHGLRLPGDLYDFHCDFHIWVCSSEPSNIANTHRGRPENCSAIGVEETQRQ